MKRILAYLLSLFISSGAVFAQQINFFQEKNSAAKASLTSDSYYLSFTLGTANFSPELRLPIQIFYDSAIKSDGLVGAGWKIPQLESSAIPDANGAVWTAPWGEKVLFYSRKKISPFGDWTANGRADSGSWTIRLDGQGNGRCQKQQGTFPL